MLASLVFDSSLLASVLEAIERRGKAIRYHNSMEGSREIDRGLERLNVDLRSGDSLEFRFSLWPAGLFWLSANKHGPRHQGGWEINEQIEGSIGQWTTSDIVARIEASMMSPADVSRIWQTDRI